MALAVPAITISAQTNIRDSVNLTPVVITASHSPKALKDAPVVTRLITLHDIKISDATNIQDLLTQEMPGLEFGFAMGQETALHMSGFGGNAILFLVDGERMAGETMDNVDYNRMSLDNVGRIEIVKGASSALYGSNAVGGVVNIISRENLEPWTANVNSRYSSFGHEWRHGANFSFNTTKWNSQTSFQHTRIDPIDLPKEHTPEEVAMELLKKAQERDTYDYHFNAYSAGLKGRYAWNRDRYLELSYAYDQYDKANFLPDGTRTHDHDYSNQQHVAHALFHQSFGKSSLIVGADYMHDYLTTYQFVEGATHSQNNIDGYAQFDWNITERLNFVGSIRYDYFSASRKKAYTERMALVYKLPWVTLRANYALGFRAPTLKEMYMHFDMGNMGYMILGNPNLEPEKSNNINLSIERTSRINNSGFLDGRYSFTLMGYCNIFEKRITTIAGDDYNGMPSAIYWNEDGIKVWALDASLAHVWDCGLSFKLNYSWMRETGNVIYSQFSQPRLHSLTWRIGYDHRFSRYYAIDAALSGRRQGKPQSGDTSVDQGYTIWKLMLQQHLWRGVSVNTAIDNLFNYKPKSYYYCSPLTTGTSFSIGVSIDLDRML